MKKIFISLLIALTPAFAFMSCTEDSALIDLENTSTDADDDDDDDSDSYDFSVNYKGQTLYFNIDTTAVNECYVTYGEEYNYAGDIEIPSQVTYNGTTYTVSGIGEKAFYETALTSITIPSSVKHIGGRAFAEAQLTSITIPSSVKYIGRWAFDRTDLTSITIPSSVEYIGVGTFSYCDELKEITVEDGNAYYVVVDDVLYTKDMTTLVAYPGGKTDSDFTMISSVDSVVVGAFDGNKHLKNLTVESNTVELDESMFDGCYNIASITVNEDNPNYTTVDGVLYNKAQTELLFYPQGKTETGFTVPATVKKIMDYAFEDCDNLRTVTMQDGLMVIQENAFNYCENLESVVIPSTTRQIMSYGFNHCSNLSSIKIYATEPFEIESDAFYDYDEDNDDYGLNYRNATLYVPAGTKSLYEDTDYWNSFVNIVEMEE